MAVPPYGLPTRMSLDVSTADRPTDRNSEWISLRVLRSCGNNQCSCSSTTSCLLHNCFTSEIELLTERQLNVHIRSLAIIFGLKMIGKGFVLFKINSSPSAFYVIKPTCISWLVFKVNKCLKKLSKTANPKVCLCCRVMTSSKWQNRNIQLVCAESAVKFNIWDVVSVVLSTLRGP